MANEFLEKIVEHKKKVNADKQGFYQRIKDKLDQTEYTSYELFKKQISKSGEINLIAEIKKASPSRGVLREEFDLMEIANTYKKEGAAAISVLTEEKFFLGKPEYVKRVSDEVKLPVLTKDFIIDEGQIYEARYNGASAILLIVAILTDQEIKQLLEVATKLDLDCLVEVHDGEELKRAISVGAKIIGVNNRNLHTFEVDTKTAHQLIPQIPDDCAKVAESGIKSHEDIVHLKDIGANAVLIGETFMKENDIAAKVKELIHG